MNNDVKKDQTTLVVRSTGWLNLCIVVWILAAVSTGAVQTVPEVAGIIHVSHRSIPAGGEFFILVEYTIPAHTHLTENFLGVSLDESEHFTTGLMQLSAGVYEMEEVVRRGKAYLKLPVSVSPSLAPGNYRFSGTASCQICTESPNLTCFPPIEIPFKRAIEVVPPGGRPEVNPESIKLAESVSMDEGATGETLDKRLESALSQGSILAFMIVFIGGFLTSLTPCVYPMIPITIGYIGARSAGGKKSKGFVLSLFYVLGLALIYSILGVLAALTGSLFGSITQTPAVIGFVALIFVIMGISMLGVFDLTLPSAVAGRLQSGGPRKGFGGAVLMGMVAGLVAAPCAGPVVIVLLAFIAASGNILFGFSLMMSFAVGMGLLFIALGTFSGLLTSLPRAGRWMDRIKKGFGIILIAAGIWIAHPILPPPLFGMLVGIGLVLFGALLGALNRAEANEPVSGQIKRAFGLIMVAAGIYIVIALLPIPGRVIPHSGQSIPSADPETPGVWRTDLEQALKDARDQKKYLILDFTAKWCAACRELDHRTFSQAAVAEKLAAVIPVRIDCTESRDPGIKEIQSRYDIIGLPTVIVLDPEGEELSRFTSFLPPDQFLKFLQKVDTI
ncbi:sulfite exporter TauE/SafE family protein [bacterium]|nr:sulfite exporter TauE/SafE family protein [candidate division CSSED10-310 bacterium]